MKGYSINKTIKIPKDVDVNIKGKIVSISGPLGKLKRNFTHASIDIRRVSDEILIEATWLNKKKMAMVGTIRSHIKNMIIGVTRGYIYKLKIAYAHFPMSVKAGEEEVIIENFHGERKPRKVKISKDVKVTVAGDDVIVQGLDIEKVSQAAASIQQGTKIRKKDPRVFLDGIFVYDKGVGN